VRKEPWVLEGFGFPPSQFPTWVSLLLPHVAMPLFTVADAVDFHGPDRRLFPDDADSAVRFPDLPAFRIRSFRGRPALSFLNISPSQI